MDFNSSSGKVSSHRMVYTRSQKDALQAWLEHNPYPDSETCEQLAKSTGVPILKLQTWFRNHRQKWKKWESKCSFPKDQTQKQVQTQLRTQEHFSTNARKHQVLLTRTQIRILLEGFERNRFPDTAARQELAEQTGMKESRIQIWFEKQRSLCSEQEREPENFSEDGTNVRPHPTTQQQQINLLACPVSSSSHQTLQHAPLASHVTCIPWESSRVSESQVPSVVIMQPTQAAQEGGSPDPPLTSVNPSPEQLTPEEGFSDTQTPLDSQPDAEPTKQLSEALSPTDISYIMQWWDKDRLALLAEWEPLKGAYTAVCQQQAVNQRAISSTQLTPPGSI